MEKLKTFLYTSEYFDFFWDSFNKVRRFFATIYRFFYYGWKLKNSFDFDFGYTEQILFLKLKKLQNCMNTDPCHRNLNDLYESLKTEENGSFDRDNTLQCIKAHRALNICVNILKRRDRGDYYSNLVGLSKFYDNVEHKSVKVEGTEYYTFESYTKDGTPYDGAKQTELYLKELEIENRDDQWLYSIISKYHNGWWT